MNNKNNKRGFSGLSNLASEISGIDESVSPEPKAAAKTASANQVLKQQRETPLTEPDQKQTTSSQSRETVSGGKSRGGLEGKCILVIIGVLFVIWLVNDGGQSSKKASYTPPPSLQTDNHPQSPPAPAVQKQRATHDAGLQYMKPSVGKNNVLSVPEIRWCIREGIRIEAMRNIIYTNEGTDEFNRMVNDYNYRCGNYRYSRGSQKRAERDVETYRSQIVFEAIRVASQLSSSSISPNPLTSNESKRTSVQHTKEAQQLLIDLGYDPGPIDGQYGRRTADAVKDFQLDIGVTQDGWITQNLLSTLRRAKTAN